MVERDDRLTGAFPWRALLLVLLVALVARALLLASGAVSFHADEAVVGLMARHILEGARPTFFYGQAYMGSLDAWLVALGFATLGESVLTIRIVQSALYLLVVATGFGVAWRLSGRVVVALVAGLFMAVPPVNTALYTTATLGGYNETLLLGNLLLWLGYDVAHAYARSGWRWGLLGLCAGIGWWANGLIVVYILPVAVMLLYVLLVKRSIRLMSAVPYIAVAFLGLIIGSAPWWVFDFGHDHAALATFIHSQQSGEFEGIGIPYVPPGQRVLGLVLIGLPALIGLRFPWESAYFLPLVGVLVLLLELFAVYHLLRNADALKPEGRLLALGMLGLFCAVFIASTFGADPTGRYFLPLTLPLGIALGTFIDWLRQRLEGRALMLLALALPVLLVLGYQAGGQVAAANSVSGLTTQFDPVSHLSNADDAQLIAFLEAHDLNHGYSNYWIAYRLAFLSDERLQYSAALPYKTDLSYNAADNRYQPLAEATENAERVAYITSNLPELDALLQADFADYDYQVEHIGPYTIYYDFDPPHPQPRTRWQPD
ncbi:MAG: glycosyltransferase family 39 protein [Anaerolineae bacterium]|nr:glycosyltransferase family 39 protein [Anaerolineae bacterium]